MLEGWGWGWGQVGCLPYGSGSGIHSVCWQTPTVGNTLSEQQHKIQLVLERGKSRTTWVFFFDCIALQSFSNAVVGSGRENGVIRLASATNVRVFDAFGFRMKHSSTVNPKTAKKCEETAGHNMRWYCFFHFCESIRCGVYRPSPQDRPGSAVGSNQEGIYRIFLHQETNAMPAPPLKISLLLYPSALLRHRSPLPLSVLDTVFRLSGDLILTPQLLETPKM